MKIEKWLLSNRYRVTGHESRESAEAHVQDLRETYQDGYGFYLITPVEQSYDGTWKFTWERGSTCD